MREQRGAGGHARRRSIRRPGGGDPLNRVLLAAAETLNEWRSVHPARRPGRAVSWLVPSWPSGLLLAKYGQRLAAGLVADRALREHVRARVGLAALTSEDETVLDEHVRKAAASASAHSSAASSESDRSEHPAVGVSRLLVARALLDPSDTTAATAAKLFRQLPLGSTGVPSEPTRTITDADVGVRSELAASTMQDHEKLPRQRQDPDLRELRRLVGASNTELARARSELSKAQAEIEALRVASVRLKQERDQARADLPSRQQRQRLENATQLAADLRKARKQLNDLRDDRVALVRAHTAQVRELENATAAAQAERDKANDSRHRQEERLGDLPGRAQYLQNLLKGRISRLEVELQDLPRNQVRTRLEKEVGQLRDLSEHLDRALPSVGVDSAALSDAVPAADGATGTQAADRPAIGQ